MFVYTLKLDANNKVKQQLNRRFKMAQDIYRRTIQEIVKRAEKQKKDPRNKQIKQIYRQVHALKNQIAELEVDLKKKPKKEQTQINALTKPLKKQIKELEAEAKPIFRQLDEDYDIVGKFTFTKYANDYRNARNYSSYIPSDVSIKLGERAWNAYEKVKFNKGAKKVNKFAQVSSIEAIKDCAITIRNGILKMGTKDKKIEVPVIYKNDEYEKGVFENKFKYNRILRKFENGEVQYYVQMIFDGIPPQKLDNYIKGTVGIDVGLTKIAVSTPNEVKILPLAPGLQNFDKEIRRLSRKLDRQRRANNPDNYNPDGTIKKGKKVWINSKGYLETKHALADLKRKQAEYRKLSHKELANAIVQMGDKFIIRQSNFEKLKERSKEDRKSATGKNLSKKRAGKTINSHAPAMFIQQLLYKAEFQNKETQVITNKDFNPYEYNHASKETIENKTHLKSINIDGFEVQKNLYAAFLVSQYENMENDNIIKSNFETFLRNQEFYIENVA